jgi:hypothetical protein
MLVAIRLALRLWPGLLFRWPGALLRLLRPLLPTLIFVLVLLHLLRSFFPDWRSWFGQRIRPALLLA